MTAFRPNPRATGLASLAACTLLWAPLARAEEHAPLPIYLEDDHAGTLQFLASSLALDRPHALVLVDAHPDSSSPHGACQHE
jgi:hypothetical protein